MKIKRFLKEKIWTARGMIILITLGLSFYFEEPILGVLASAYLIFFLSKKVADIKYTRSFENFIMIFLVLSNFLGGDVGFMILCPGGIRCFTSFMAWLSH